MNHVGLTESSWATLMNTRDILNIFKKWFSNWWAATHQLGKHLPSPFKGWGGGKAATWSPGLCCCCGWKEAFVFTVQGVLGAFYRVLLATKHIKKKKKKGARVLRHEFCVETGNALSPLSFSDFCRHREPCRECPRPPITAVTAGKYKVLLSPVAAVQSWASYCYLPPSSTITVSTPLPFSHLGHMSAK